MCLDVPFPKLAIAFCKTELTHITTQLRISLSPHVLRFLDKPRVPLSDQVLAEYQCSFVEVLPSLRRVKNSANRSMGESLALPKSETSQSQPVDS